MGAILLHPSDMFPLVRDVLSTNDFYRRAHQQIYRAMVEVDEERGPEAIDLLTVKERLIARGELEDVGGPVYISALVDGVPRSTNIVEYAEIMRELKRRREVITGLNRIVAHAYDGDNVSTDVIVAQVDTLAQEALGNAQFGEIVRPPEAVSTFLDLVEYRHKHRDTLLGVSTGFPSLDEITCGLVASELITLAADTGVGKSSMALQVGMHVASTYRLAVPLFTLEMTRDETMFRMAAIETGCHVFKARAGWLSPAERDAVTIAMSKWAALPLYIDDTAGITLAQIRAKCRRIAAEHGGKLGLIIIDYVQLVETDRPLSKDYTRTMQLSEITRGLKRFARQIDAPLMILSQLNRDAKKQNRPPELHDLRESGTIEQDSNAVMFIYTPPEKEQHKEEETLKSLPDGSILSYLLVRKQRNGPAPATIKVAFEKNATRFIDVKHEEKLYAQPTQSDLPAERAFAPS